MCLDAHFNNDEKLSSCSVPARFLFVTFAAYCTQELTDGRIPRVMMTRLLAAAGCKRNRLQELLAAGLVVRIGDEVEVSENPDDYYIPAYLTWNPSRADIEREREAARLRQRAKRERDELHQHLRAV